MYIATLAEIKFDPFVEVPNQIAKVLEDFVDIMPFQLPKALPPRCAYDHKVELEPSVKPPTCALYRIALSKLAELQK